MNEEEIRAQFYVDNPDGSSTCRISNTEVDNVQVSDGGIAQVTFNIQENPNSTPHQVTITYNPNDTASMQNILTMNVGSGGYADVGTDLDHMALNEGLNHITVTYHNAYTENQNSNLAVKEVLTILNKDYGVEYQSMVSSGASAGAQNSADLALLCQDIVNKPVNIMLIDAADDASRFTNHLLNNPDLLEDFISNGGTVYAYEADKFSQYSPRNVSGAKTNLAKLAEAGVNIVLVENPNADFHMSQYGINVKSGEVYNIFNDFNQEMIVRNTSVTTDYTSQKYFEGYNAYANENIYEYYYDGKWNQTTTLAINRYQNSRYRQMRSDYFNLTQLQDINNLQNIDGFTSLAYSDNLPISVEYKSVADNTNAIINAIGHTSFLNDTFGYQLCQSTSSFPDSLNNSNAFLFNTTGKMLFSLAGETKAIENILRNYSYMDKDLALRAQLLGSGVNEYIITNDELIYDVRPIEIDNIYLDTFPTNIQKGTVGIINVSDINNILENGSLTGVIGNSLQNEINDANYLKEVINNLITNNNIQGPGWDSVLNHLNSYNNYCDMRLKAANILQDAYVRSLNLVKEYMYPDTELDDSKIVELNAQISRQKRIIANLIAKANTFVYQTCYDSWDKEFKNGYQIKVYPFRYLLDRVPIYEEIVDDLTKEVQKLEGLADIMNQANQIVQDAIVEVNNIYNTPVSHINPIIVQDYSSLITI